MTVIHVLIKRISTCHLPEWVPFHSIPVKDRKKCSWQRDSCQAPRAESIHPQDLSSHFRFEVFRLVKVQDACRKVFLQTLKHQKETSCSVTHSLLQQNRTLRWKLNLNKDLLNAECDISLLLLDMECFTTCLKVFDAAVQKSVRSCLRVRTETEVRLQQNSRKKNYETRWTVVVRAGQFPSRAVSHSAGFFLQDCFGTSL